MNKLTKDAFEKSYRYIMEIGRPLEAAFCIHHFTQPSPQLVLAELQKYQNSDGGFGNGLEPDFQLPNSSPMATSIALQTLTKFDSLPEAKSMIKDAIKYLESSYVPERNGWLAVPATVNNYPHTPWWHYNSGKNMSIIDEHWGNPSAEIVGYLYNYKGYVTNLNVDHILATAFTNLNNKTEFDFHDIYCYIRLHNLLPKEQAVKIQDKITEAVQDLLSPNPAEWENDYQPKPMDFVGESVYRFGVSQELIETNIDYFIEKLEQNSLMLPSWGKHFYIDDLEDSWKEWLGILTLQTLICLKTEDRIDK